MEDNNTQQESKFDVGIINEHFKTSFTDEGSLKEIFEEANKIPEYKSQIQDKEAQLSGLKAQADNYNLLLEELNSGNFLPDPELLAVKQLSKKFQNVDVGTLSQVRSSDIEAMNKLDALVLADKINVKSSASDAVRKQEILKKLGIDSEPTELTENDIYRIDLAYASQKQVLEEIKGFRPEGLKVDYKAELESRKAQRENEMKARENEQKTLGEYNKKMIEPILKDFTEIKRVAKDDKGKQIEVKYAVDPKFKDEFMTTELEALNNLGFKVTSQNADEVINYVAERYIVKHFDDILNAMANQIASAKSEEFHNEVHVDSSTNRTEAPPTGQAKVIPTIGESLLNGVNKKRK